MEKETKIYFSNHAGKHIAEYIREEEDGAYTTLICKLNGFDGETRIPCFRYQGQIQSSYSLSLSNQANEPK